MLDTRITSPPRLEALRATIAYEPAFVGLVRVEACAGTATSAALRAAYGDARCIVPEPDVLAREGSNPQMPLWEYLARQFDQVYLEGLTIGERIGRSILESQPPFWEEVRQLTFSFEDEDFPSIRGFYNAHGPLGYPLRQQPIVHSGEPWGWCLASLRWFRQATHLLTLIRERRTEALWECFGEPRSVSVDSAASLANVFLREEPFYDQRDYEWRYDTPLVDHLDRTWTSPRNDDELYKVAVALLGKVVSLELQKIPVAPLNTPAHHVPHPVLLWGFRPAGALHAAFLQWFFRELAGLEVRTCAAEGCDNIVLPPQKKYCSRTCEQRMLQQRYRERQAVAATLHREGKSIDEIRRIIMDQYGMKKRPKAEVVRGWIMKSGSKRT